MAGAASTFVLIAVSLFTPWWQFTLGDPAIFQVNLSPVNTTFTGIGNSFTIPLIWALNIASLLSLIAGGTGMLAYAVMPSKPYSKRLLHFAYNKPLFAVVFFAISLLALIVTANGIFGLAVPLTGASVVRLPQAMTAGATISIRFSADFLWPFWLAAVTAGLCVAARFYHRKIA